MNLAKVDLNSLGPVRQSRHLRTAPCEKRFLDKWNLVQEIKSKEKDQRKVFQAIGTLAKDDYWFFLRAVLGYRFLDPWDHGEELIHFVTSNLGRPLLIMVPRGGMKTGSLTVPFIPWLITRDPTLRSIITNVRDPKAQFFGREAASIISSSIYQKCFVNDNFESYLKPSRIWGKDGYVLENIDINGSQVQGRVDPTIKCLGVGGNITGSHVRCIIHDDLINETTADSAIELEKAEAFFKESLNCLDPGGQIMNICTRWRFNDFYGKIEDGEIQGNDGRFLVFKRGAERVVLDDEGQPVVEIFNQRRTYVDVNGKPQQVGYDRTFLDAQKANHGQYYSALYMNEPLSDENRDFAVEQVRTYTKFPSKLGPAHRVGVEIEGGAASFYSTLRDTMREEQKIFGLEKLTAPRDIEKHAKIRSSVQPLIEAGRFYIREDLWTKPGSLGQEIREFDKGEDDALDALDMAIRRAPKNVLGRAPLPYIAVDPAFTANRQSNYTAIVVGCYYGEDFYVLDCDKFKAQKTTFIIGRIFRMWERWRVGRLDFTHRAADVIRQIGPGNKYVKRAPKGGQDNIWGEGIYSTNNNNYEEFETN